MKASYLFLYTIPHPLCSGVSHQSDWFISNKLPGIHDLKRATRLLVTDTSLSKSRNFTHDDPRYLVAQEILPESRPVLDCRDELR